MANSHETLTGLFTDIADAIRSKSGSSESIVADNFPGAISAISTQENLDAELATQDSLIAQITTAVEGKAGVTLPVLSNPASAGNIEAGYQAITSNGSIVEGEASVVKTSSATWDMGIYSSSIAASTSSLQTNGSWSSTILGNMFYLTDYPQVIGLVCSNGLQVYNTGSTIVEVTGNVKLTIVKW